MLQILLALSVVSPIVLRCRTMLAVRHWMALVLRLMLGFAVAIFTYFGVLFVIVETYPHSQTLGGVIYDAGFFFATVVAAITGTLVSPTRLSWILTPGICVLAIMFPLGLNLYFSFIATWRGAYVLYVMGSIGGAYAVGWVTSRAKASSLSYAAPIVGTTAEGPG